MNDGKRIVLTAPFTEMIDHAGYFIQMGMASIPIWLEWVMDRSTPPSVLSLKCASQYAPPCR